MVNTTELMESAIEIAKKAGQVAIKGQSSLKDGDISYKFPNKRGVVTKYDLEIDSLIRNFVLQKYPNHSIISEEEDPINNGQEVVWVVDPIDGTRNFVNGKKEFAISIGIVINGKFSVGVIYSPALDLLYSSDGSDFRINGEVIKRSKLSNFCFFNDNRLINKGPKDLFAGCEASDTGSAALNLAFCAEGRAVGSIMEGVMIWDVAAGIVLIESNGGKIMNFDYKSFELTDHNIIAIYK